MIPAEMRAVGLNGAGGPEVLVPVTLPVPHPGAGQVLIRVQAAGVNRPDIAQREGRYPVPADASPIPGLEVAGRIAVLGDGVSDWAVGDAVCALVHGGGYADYAVADAGTVLPVPEGLDMAMAAALPEVVLTVEVNMIQRAGLTSGETVLIHGGSSGIGSHAIERALAQGATPIVTVGTEAKADWCRALGAALAINYRTQDFEAEVRAFTQGRGVDVVLDMVGGPYVARNLRSLALDGRYALISLQGGRDVQASFEPVLRNRLTITGSTLRPLPPARKAVLTTEVRRTVWPMIAAGAIRPRLSHRFPLEQAADAHRAMESPDHRGKIVLDVAADR
ncbi:MAG: NAD(P)H-quinone oxidoreductase [Rhodobacter sp.]|nr:NAD(P)H-quinone oxidoreductase [Rhodobacter sp.]